MFRGCLSIPTDGNLLSSINLLIIINHNLKSANAGNILLNLSFKVKIFLNQYNQEKPFY